MHFVIGGRINCLQFSFALMVAQRLQEKLPEFSYLKIPKKPEEYEKWLAATCSENGWYHIESPIIWREVAAKKGKKQLIGNINKFLDLCYDYYGVSRELLSAESFNKGEMEWFAHRTEVEYYNSIKREAKIRTSYRARQVCITGASTQTAEIIIMELLQMSSQKREDGLEIRLFDEASKSKKLESSANDAKFCPGPSGFGNCRVVTSLREAFTRVDLVIVLDSFPRRQKETVIKWLKRNRNAMAALGHALNLFAPSHCRVIIGNPSTQPICYNATVVAAFATRLHVRNIVAVSQDLGREMLKNLSSKVNVPVAEFYCPPVWGFVGLNKHIDITRTLQTHLYKIPGKRVHSTIPQGSEEFELRTTECLLDEEQTTEIHDTVNRHKCEITPQLGRQPCLAKATAILDLLRIWGITRENGNGEIISLGIYSDGSFNIPEGVYWSQPAILKDGFWVPFKKFPVPRQYYFNCHSLFIYSIAALYRTRVKPRKFEESKPKLLPKETKKFDFNKILEEVGMPVIRTDLECYNYLKYLAKKELGIDFDATDFGIIEVDEPETPPPMETIRYQTYCECWRQELKEMQKVIFDRSSTTEIEVDLTDNLSSSECSIINPRVQVQEVEKESRLAVTQSMQSKKDTVSTVTLCSCATLSDGSPCKCLLPKETTPTESTEHYYKEQNAEVYDKDQTDVIYEDNFDKEKSVCFDENAKLEDVEDRSRFKFYGKKDAIRDEKAERKMRDRIFKYEHPGEGMIGETSESKSSASLLGLETTQDSKLHTSFDDYSSENTDEVVQQFSGVQPGPVSKSSHTSFREMYTDKIIPPIKIYATDGDFAASSSEKNISAYEEGGEYEDMKYVFEGEAVEPTYPPQFSERSSMKSWEAGYAYEEFEEEMEPELNLASSLTDQKKRKREGIPLCCLCRCIVPEGLACCPCGTTTVVEVFKKESVEVFVEEESELTFRVEYIETEIPPEMSLSSSSFSNGLTGFLDELETERKVDVDFDGDKKKIDDERKKDLPPESFFPFSPKHPNVIVPPSRPTELTQEYFYTQNEELLTVPDKCLELMELAKKKIEEDEQRKLQQMQEKEEKKKAKESEKKTESEKTKSDEEEIPELLCEESERKIKTDFSNLNFITLGIEDWRVTVQKKYEDWFFSEAEIRDETYYDPAIEEVSDDEYEVDKELEQYFEV